MMVLNSTLEISANLFGGGARLQSLTTSSNVADNGFEGLSQITSLTFNNVSGLNKIGAYAFAGCTGISDLNIPNNFNASEGNESPIGDYAFENCTGIVKLTFCADTLNNTVFSGCTNIATLQIMTTANVGMKDNFAGGANIVTLTTYSNNTVFSYSSKLETVYFYGTSIAQNAFFACDSLKDVYIDDSVETINSGAFARCTNLLYLFIPKSVTTLTSVFTFGPFTGAGGWDSEINCYLIKIYFETASELDGFQDGWRKNELTDDVNIFWGIDRKTYNGLVNNNGFMYETVNGKKYIKSYLGGEKEIEIPEDVYGISNRAFDKSSLTSITIPSNVKYIDAYAFAESQYLETVTIQSACVIGAGAFENCPMLKNVDLGPSIAVENYCFNGVTLSELTIPNTLTSIDEDAFIGLTVEKLYVELETVPQTRLCLEVKVIILSDNVKTLSQNSFSGCSGLSYLFLPQTVTTINRGAFYGCDNLMNIFCDYNYVHYTPDGWADNWYYYGSGSTEYYWRSYNDAGITLFTPSNEGTHYGINGAIRMNYTVGQFEEFLTKYDIVSTSASGEQIGESVLVSPMGKDGFQKKFVYGVMAFMLLCSGAVVTIMLLKSKKKENVLDDYDE
ncbi:MAG: leucine-rich repeat domain-containing protein [Clostridia bacterium]|nr:leucine-rich repeat domain-containing protein [Clostridia bacterium]